MRGEITQEDKERNYRHYGTLADRLVSLTDLHAAGAS